MDRIPVWFMRQAGRYMEEYQAIRREHSLLDICHQPKLAAEVTMQPIRRFEVDAAIVFADILLPLTPLGVPFDFLKGRGPVIEKPVRAAADLARLKPFDPRDQLDFVLEAIERVRDELSPEIALIGFAGGPFTVVSYMIEGGSSRNFLETKRLLFEDEPTWHKLMDLVARVTADYLVAQIDAGADAVQLFDSWVGCLGPADYERYVLPHSRSIFDRLEAKGVPLIHFGTGTSELLPLLRAAGGTVIGVDWRIRMDTARERLGADVALQGNLDPVSLLAPPDLLRMRVQHVLDQMKGDGYIFNLGHGILPPTPVENVASVAKWVHAHVPTTHSTA